MEISGKAVATLKKMQRNEITEYHIYTRIAQRTKNEENKKVLLRIAAEEKAHADIWQKYTRTEQKPNKLSVWWYAMLARVLGITFALKKMESGEDAANKVYAQLIAEVPEAKHIAEEEDRHEQELLGMLDEERLRYVGSMVLGLNDALVELTGTLAGLTFAMANTRLVALSGLITGISATLSMASSEFLSARAEGRPDAFKSSIYTKVRASLKPGAALSGVRRRAVRLRAYSHAGDCRGNNRGIQLLHIGGEGAKLQEALFGDGGDKPNRRGRILRYRLARQAIFGG